MKPMVAKSIRVIGIVVTALLIPVSILALFLLLQETGNAHQAVLILSIAWALVNFIAMPFILLGFIIRYTMKSVLYLAVAHFTLSLANVALLITSATLGSVTLLAVITLPSLLYIIGLIAHTQRIKEKHRAKEEEGDNQNTATNTAT